jgi:hypothetical protein
MDSKLWITLLMAFFLLGIFVGQLSAPKPKTFTIPWNDPFWTHRDDLPIVTDNNTDNQTINIRWQDKSTTIRYKVSSDNSTTQLP